MRIAIDLTALNATPSGIDRSLLGLVAALAEADAANEYVVFANFEDRRLFRRSRRAGSPPAAIRLPARSRVLLSALRPRGPRLIFQQILLPAMLDALGVDLLHSPTFVMPARRGRQRHVLTVHDMTSFLAPQHHPRRRRGSLYRAAIAGSIRRADLVTVPAPAVRQDILRLLPDVRPERVRVVPWGIGEGFHPQSEPAARAAALRLGLSAPYILHVGTLDPRKNLSTLVEAFAQLVADGDRPEHLVLAGQAGWSMAKLLDRMRAPALRDRVHVVGFVPEPDLAGLYGGARLFVCPSFLEGFGFPPLEAMATGIPVVASATSSLLDNLHGAARLVPPGDPDALAGTMRRVLSDESEWNRLARAGMERAADFRWDRCAREFRGIYEELT